MANDGPASPDVSREAVELGDEELDRAAGGALPDSLKKRLGNVAEQGVEKATRTCPHCKETIAKTDIFCPKCHAFLLFAPSSKDAE